MLVPKLRENGWRSELNEASNMKKWKVLVSKALERGYDNIMLVEKHWSMQGESSNIVPVVNLDAANAKQTYVCDNDAVQNTDDAEEQEYGWHMEADQGGGRKNRRTDGAL